MTAQEQVIFNLFPLNYRSAMKSISLSKLKTKYTINETKVQSAYNVIVNLPVSAYYPNGKSTVICKLCDDILFLPDTGETVSISDIDKVNDFVIRCINQSFFAASFGCCSRYSECSNAKTCVHENPFYSFGCIYRSHLETGEIFYGVNRNV